MCFAGAALSAGWLIGAGAGVCAIGVGSTWEFDVCADAASENRPSAATAKCFFIRDLRILDGWTIPVHGVLTFQKSPSLTVWPDGDADLIIFDAFAKRSSHHVIELRALISEKSH